MGKLKALLVRIVAWMARRLGQETVPAGVLPPAGIVMPEASLRVVDGVKLLSLKVWTEGEDGCKHDYRKVKALNSHKNSVAASLGKSAHSDYTCSKCTHRLCVTEWEKPNG